MTSISEEEENYVRISLLLTGVAPRAVRCKFDREFAPAVLPATIRKGYNKLFDLKEKRVINKLQWNVLHPRNGTPDSKDFDITLMICLLRNLTTIAPTSVGYNYLPPSWLISDEADLARIKYYRNYLSHLDHTKIDNAYFTTSWTDVADAVGRLGGQSMVQECQKLKVKILDQSNKEIMLEIKQSQKEMQELKDLQKDMRKEVQTLEASNRDLKTSYDSLKGDYVSLKSDHDDKRKEIDKLKAAQEDTVRWNIRGQINRKLETWKKDDIMFMETRAAKYVLECVKTNSCVTVTGSSGMGKTFTVRHAALKMAEDGYDILPVTNPDDIGKFYNPNKKALFLIDNFCGTYTLNQNVLDKWKSLSDTIKDILEDKGTKIIVSCRSQVYQDDMFKTLPLFTSCVCNFMSKELCLLLTERTSLAKLYLKTDASKISQYVNLYDCFPLLCKLYKENPNFDVTEFFKNPFSVYEAEVSKLWTEGAHGKYCALALCVMFNNHLKDKWLTEDIDKDTWTVIENTCEACKLDKGTPRLVIRDELESLTNTFIRKYKEDNEGNSNFYCTIHDKLFDYLVSYFGKVMIQCFIKNADSRSIAERFLFEKQDDSDQFTIYVPNKYQQMYLQRMVDDWSRGYLSDVFNNVNMKIQTFRDIFHEYLNKLEPFFQNKLVEMCNMSYNTTDKSYQRKFWEEYSSTTPMIHCCLVGDINMVEWFCKHGSDVNQTNSKMEFPLYMACLKGHTIIVTKLLDIQADVNQCTNEGQSPLYIACKGGYTEVVTKLLHNKADVYKCTKWGKSSLYIACEGRYTEIVTKLLDNKADVNQCTDDGISPLYIACKRGYSEVVTKLLDNKADVNQCERRGKSPLHIACEGGYTEVVNKLLENKADVNQCTKWGESPLYIACKGGCTEVVTKLLDNKADVNQCRGGVPPMYIACKGGYTDVVTKLLDNMADVNQCTEWRESPLYIACEGGYTAVVTKLLDNKADVNQCNKWGDSPLFIACKEGYTEVVTKLLDNKADVNQCTGSGESPLCEASGGGYTEIVTKLLDNKADVDQCNKVKESPLYIACDRMYTEIVAKLLDNKADVNQCSKWGASPLYIACARGCTEVVTKLLDNKADVNHCTKRKESPLYVACTAGVTEIVTKLLDNKADVDQCNEVKESPLYIACDRMYTEIVAKLLDNKADVNQCSKWGASPLYIACARGCTEVVTKLLDNKADVNHCTKRKESPLYVACTAGVTEIVTKLLDNKADVNQCTSDGVSPLCIACSTWSKLRNHESFYMFLTSSRIMPFSFEDTYRYINTVKLLMNAGADCTLGRYNGESPLDLIQDQDIRDLILSWKLKPQAT